MIGGVPLHAIASVGLRHVKDASGLVDDVRYDTAKLAALKGHLAVIEQLLELLAAPQEPKLGQLPFGYPATQWVVKNCGSHGVPTPVAPSDLPVTRHIWPDAAQEASE